MLKVMRQHQAPSKMEDLAKSFAPILRGFFSRRVRERADVEDLVQEVFLRLIRRGNIGNVANVEGYLFQTAANVLRDRGRRRIARHANDHEPISDEYESLAADATFSPERVLQGQQAISRMSDALLLLPDMSRTILVLCRLERMPYADVAKALGISLSSVNKHLAKATDQLMEQMRDVL